MKLKILLLLCLSLTAEAKILNIPRVKQETNMWCWLASSEMVNEYYGVKSLDKDPDMQCSTIRYMANRNMIPSECFFDCKSCAYPAYTMENFKIPLDSYSTEAALNGGESVATTLSNKPASVKRLKKEINANHPMIIGVNPSLTGKKDVAEHAIVVIGYSVDKNGKTIVRVNDPYNVDTLRKNPYDFVGATKISDGVYDISYKELLKSFAWQSTIYIRRSK